MQHTILITGGAGYIGSHIALHAVLEGASIIVVDRRPDFPAIFKQYPIIYYQADITKPGVLDHIFAHHAIDVIIHCAALIEVGASVTDPYSYYDNNVNGALVLLRAMRTAHINQLIFSSSCAVFGSSQLPLHEDLPRAPISPYGRTKYMVELMVEDAAHAYGLHAVILRYFNAAGAWPEMGLGERHEPETHLIPRLLKAATMRLPIQIFGDDYPTPDGTCIRDYVHVRDLAAAHLQAVKYLREHQPRCISFNLGTGSGCSVYELITQVRRITKINCTVERHPRRLGDPPVLIADARAARRDLEWEPRRSLSSMIIEDAYQFFLTGIKY